jgi:amino acid transporter
VNWGKYGAAVVAVLWAYHGWMNIGPVAEEVRDPQRNIPLALLGGVVLLIGLYVGANVAYYTVIPRDEMKELKNTTVATVFCLRLVGNIGLVIASLIVMTSAFGSLNGNILVAPRLLYAMGRDGVLPSRAFAYVSPRTRTPAFNLALSAVVGLLALVLTEEQGASLVNFGAFVAFTSVNLSVVATWLASRDGARPSTFAWLVLPLLGTSFTLWLLLSLDTHAKIAGLAWSSLGVLWLLRLTGFFRRATPTLATE